VNSDDVRDYIHERLQEVLSEFKGSDANMLRVTLDDEEADWLLAMVTLLSGGDTLTEREQLILLLGVRFMLRRNAWVDEAVSAAVADAVDRHLRPSEN
jgi:hypothetical protein